jgi:3-deoxy-manno-octulosonate cytidylyltransferase (CMP-KDO synthetase)
MLQSNLKINENVFHHIGVYAYHKQFLLDFISLSPTQRELDEKLEQLRIININKIGISIIKEEILGVDTKEDLDRVNRLILKNE